MSDNKNNPVLRAISERRSIRKYGAAPVTPEQLQTILRAGLEAPTGHGRNPVRFLVLGNTDPRRRFFAAGCKHSGPYVSSAPCFIALFLERADMYDTMKNHQAAGACIQNMLLAAHALGLGTVWIGEITNTAREITEQLGLDPEKLSLQAGICLGFPAETPKARKKAEPESVLLDQLPEEFK